MNLKNEVCQVFISTDDSYVINSAENKHYDIIHNPGNKSEFYKTFSIEISNKKEKIKIALIGDYYIYNDDCAILKENVLTILQNDSISQINVLSGKLMFYTIIDGFGCNLGIYETGLGYIIYGEVEIKMLDFDFNTKWKFSGKDIFVSKSGRKAFELCEDRIKLYDFNDCYYEIDFNGNERL